MSTVGERSKRVEAGGRSLCGNLFRRQEFIVDDSTIIWVFIAVLVVLAILAFIFARSRPGRWHIHTVIKWRRLGAV